MGFWIGSATVWRSVGALRCARQRQPLTHLVAGGRRRRLIPQGISTDSPTRTVACRSSEPPTAPSSRSARPPRPHARRCSGSYRRRRGKGLDSGGGIGLCLGSRPGGDSRKKIKGESVDTEKKELVSAAPFGFIFLLLRPSKFVPLYL